MAILSCIISSSVIYSDVPERKVSHCMKSGLTQMNVLNYWIRLVSEIVVAEQPQAIAQLAELVDQGVNLHVCGAHSSWRNIDPSEYIEIVDVAGSAPAQINDYIKLGYQHILIQKPL